MRKKHKAAAAAVTQTLNTYWLLFLLGNVHSSPNRQERGRKSHPWNTAQTVLITTVLCPILEFRPQIKNRHSTMLHSIIYLYTLVK